MIELWLSLGIWRWAIIGYCCGCWLFSAVQVHRAYQGTLN